MNYPYNLAIATELDRYIKDIRSEPPEVQEEIRQYHLKMAEYCREAAKDIAIMPID